MDEQLTQEQAKALFDAEFWKTLTVEDRARMQLWQTRLFMPFGEFHSAIETTLGRPVYTHEFGLNVDGLKEEMLGLRPAPTLQEIIEQIPAEKRILLQV